MKRFLAIAGLMLAATCTPLHAGFVTFDEIAPANSNSGFLTTEYLASQGITFVTTDDGSIWGGNSQGNPGNWGLEGTNGPQFLGFNGNSDKMDALFTGQIKNFTLDASRSNGSSAGDQFTLEGYLGGSLVESQTITFGAINTWTTLTLTSVVDKIHVVGTGAGFNPYGLDNFTWDPVPEPTSLAMWGLGAFGACVCARRRKRKQA